MESFRLNPTHGDQVITWADAERIAAAPMASAEMVNGAFEITGYLVHSGTDNRGGFFGTLATISVKNNDGVYVGYTIRWAHTESMSSKGMHKVATYRATSNYVNDLGQTIAHFERVTN